MKIFTLLLTASLAITLSVKLKAQIAATPFKTHTSIGSVGSSNSGAVAVTNSAPATVASCTNPPLAGTITGPSNVNVGTSYSWTISPTVGNLQWYNSASASHTAALTAISGITTAVTPALVYSGGGVGYLSVIASSPGCPSDTSNIYFQVNVTYQGDDVCNAIPLALGTSTVQYSIFGTTIQTGEVAPPATGFTTNTGWGNSTLNNTRWFSFVAPASGYVSVQSPDFDTQLAVWKASACGNLLSASTASLVAANDDDASYLLHGGVQYSSYLRAACLTPGTTYYIQLDSYDPAISIDLTKVIVMDMGTPLNTSFSGLASNYCTGSSSPSFTPAVTGGIFTVNSNTTSVTSFSASTAGTYTVNYSIFGCRSNSTTIVGGVPTVSANSNPVCLGNPVTLTGNGASTYTWTGGITNGVSFTPSVTTTYILASSNSSICPGTYTTAVTVTVNPLPVAGIISGPTNINTGSSYTWTVSPTIGNLQWYTSASASHTSALNAISGVTAAVTSSLSSSLVGTIYLTVIASSPGCLSDTSNTYFQINTSSNFPGDNSCTAIPLPIGTSTVQYSVFGASAQVGEVAPAASTFTANNGWGDSFLDNTLWFTFVAPTSGYVSVQSPGFDTQLAVWKASSCGDLLSASTATLVGANDDDPDYMSHGGVQYSSYVRAACLTPGVTYYIQLDSFDPAISTNSTKVIVMDMGAPLNASFTGLAASYCMGLSSPSFTPALTGGVFTVNTSTSSITSFSASSVGPNTVTYSIYGCNTNSVVTVNPLPTVSVSSNSSLLCTGQSANLTISGTATSYSLNAMTTATTVSVSPTTTTTYSISGTDANGCSNSVTFTQSVSVCTGISSANELENNYISVYPNPNSGSFYVKSNKEQVIIITNELGQIISSIYLNSASNYEAQVNGLARGIYFMSNDHYRNKIVVTQ